MAPKKNTSQSQAPTRRSTRPSTQTYTSTVDSRERLSSQAPPKKKAKTAPKKGRRRNVLSDDEEDWSSELEEQTDEEDIIPATKPVPTMAKRLAEKIAADNIKSKPVPTKPVTPPPPKSKMHTLVTSLEEAFKAPTPRTKHSSKIKQVSYSSSK